MNIPPPEVTPLRAEPPSSPVELVGTAPGSLEPAAGTTVQQASRTVQGDEDEISQGEITTSLISFRDGSDQLTDQARAELTAVAQLMAVNRDLAAGIYGYADRGASDAAQRRRWSLLRSMVVRNFLVANGVEPGRAVARILARPASDSVSNDDIVVVLQDQP